MTPNYQSTYSLLRGLRGLAKYTSNFGVISTLNLRVVVKKYRRPGAAQEEAGREAARRSRRRGLGFRVSGLGFRV